MVTEMECASPSGFQQLPQSQWPADCQQLLVAATAGGNPFSKQPNSWQSVSEKTRIMRLQDFGIFLDWLMSSGRYDHNRPVSEQVTTALAEAFYRDIEAAELGYYTRACRLNGLYACLRRLAPTKDWLWLQMVARECERFAKETKTWPEHQPLTTELFEAACILLRRSVQPGLSALESAVLYRDGLLIMFFALAGPRRGTVAIMTLGVHLKKEGDTWIVQWPAAEMKGRRKSMRRELPEILKLTFVRYLEVHRPVLLAQAKKPSLDAAQAVWVSMRGTRLCESSIYKQVCQQTSAVLGFKVNPHAFRHAGATTLAMKHPKDVSLATPWLGHTTPETARDFYILAQDLSAGTRFASMLEDIRIGRRRGSCTS